MRVIALEYHDIVDGTNWGSSGFSGNSADSYKMSASRFDTHLDAVASVPNEMCNDVRTIAAAGRARPRVLFTFDDGGASAAHIVADRLERRGWRGHFLITTGRIGSPGFLSAGELIDLHRRGHVIGSHTETHPARMSFLSRTEQLQEWARSRSQLEEILGVSVVVASVPGGYFDQEVAAAAAAAGIGWLFTSEPETRVAAAAECLIIGRFTLRRNSPAGLARALVSRLPAARVGQWLTWNAKKAAKRLAGDGYLRLRATLFGEHPPASGGHETR